MSFELNVWYGNVWPRKWYVRRGNCNYFGGGKDVFLERQKMHMRGICIYTEERGQISCRIKGS